MRNLLVMITALALLCALSACGVSGADTSGAASKPEDSPEEPSGQESETAPPESEVPEVDTTGMAEAVVMTYNIFYQDVERRAPLIEELLVQYRPDVLGLQEVSYDWVGPLKDFMESQSYDYYGYGRHGAELSSENLDSSEQFAFVLWQADKYELVDSGHFWASSTPEVSRSSSWIDGVTSSFPRCINWVKLKDRQTGREMVFLTCHLAPNPENDMVRNHSARLIVEQMRSFTDEGIPVLLMGDFNMKITDAPYSVITDRGYNDARFVAQETTDSGTFNAFDHQREPNWGLIDYIFITPNVVAETFEVIDCRQWDGEFRSDHFPIRVKIFY